MYSKLRTLFLLVFLLGISNQVFFSKTQEKTVFTRSKYLEQPKLSASGDSPDDHNIQTYKMELSIEFDEKDQVHNEKTEQDFLIETTTIVQHTYLPETDQFEIIVGINSVKQRMEQKGENSNQNLQSQLLDQENKNIEVEQFKNTLLYKLIVQNESGEVIAMYGPDQKQIKIIVWGVQQLVNNIFPDIRALTYNNPETTPTETDGLGVYKPEQQMEEIDEDLIQLRKKFGTENYVEYEIQDIKQPDQQFERNLFIEKNTGIVQGGQSEFTFKMDNDQVEENEEMMKVDINELDIEIQNLFYILENEKESVKDFLNTVENMKNQIQNDFVEIPLMNKEEKAQQIVIDQEEEEQIDQQNLQFSNQPEGEQENATTKLKGRELSIEKTAVLKSMVIYNQVIEAKFQAYGDDEIIEFYVYITHNDKIIYIVFGQTFYNTKGVWEQSDQFEKTVLNLTYPLLGIIRVGIEVSLGFQYQYRFEYNAYQQLANLDIQSSASLSGRGYNSIMEVAKAGLYARGIFFDNHLKFYSQMDYNKFSSQLQVSRAAFSYDMGFYYQYYTCDTGEFFSLKWYDMCSMGSEKQYSVYSGSTQRKTYDLWNVQGYQIW